MEQINKMDFECITHVKMTETPFSPFARFMRAIKGHEIMYVPTGKIVDRAGVFWSNFQKNPEGIWLDNNYKMIPKINQ